MKKKITIAFFLLLVAGCKKKEPDISAQFTTPEPEYYEEVRELNKTEAPVVDEVATSNPYDENRDNIEQDSMGHL